MPFTACNYLIFSFFGKFSKLSRDFVDTLYVGVQHNFGRDVVSSGEVNMNHVPSADNSADLLAKLLVKFKHKETTRSKGVVTL